ncbi:hypothetical protein B0A54_01669 [Friedmanniomyces endolithicus]|uniref:Cell wall protein n=1 Tax=Friedmanniomyces endolithicus TaxID=329885 RepID=A0A4U0VIN0_9PEZI|nr:hypothetical protein B0A54_01669 [Friedmanniomyces endolithicus]
MKSFFTVLALPALFASTLAAPTAIPADAAIEKRQAAAAYAIVDSLYTNIQQYTDETAAGISSNSTTAQNATAATSFITNIESITTAVGAATAEVKLLPVASVVRRQTEAALAGLVENLLLELSASLLGSLNPLVSSLSALLLSLEPVVNNLLALVQQLVDGLLTGLSVGLSGLVL